MQIEQLADLFYMIAPPRDDAFVGERAVCKFCGRVLLQQRVWLRDGVLLRALLHRRHSPLYH
jgi:hypothetical protein